MVGLEVELILVVRAGKHRGEAVDAFDDVRSAVTAAAAYQEKQPVPDLRYAALLEHLQNEMKPCLIEVKSAPSTSIDEAADDVDAKIALLQEICAVLGLDLLPMAVHPTMVARDHPNYDDERMAVLRDHLGDVARLQQCVATHGHVAVMAEDDAPKLSEGDLIARAEPLIAKLARGSVDTAVGNAATRAVEALSMLAPALIALSAASPWADGEDSGLSSWRTPMWGLMPTVGPLPRLHGSLTEYVGWMLLTGASNTSTSWKDYKPTARVTPYGTVEGRAADAVPTRREREAILALIVATTIAAVEGRLPEQLKAAEQGITSHNMEQAARYGLGPDDLGHARDTFILAKTATHGSAPPTKKIADYVVALTGGLQEIAEEYGFAHNLAKVHEILTIGNSASRQRVVFATARRDLVTAAGRPLTDAQALLVVMDTCRWEQAHDEMTLTPMPENNVPERQRVFTREEYAIRSRRAVQSTAVPSGRSSRATPLRGGRAHAGPSSVTPPAGHIGPEPPALN